jgi:hypothetical protein
MAINIVANKFVLESNLDFVGFEVLRAGNLLEHDAV